MAEPGASGWGAKQRYYAQQRGGQQAGIAKDPRLLELLKRFDPELEQRVQRSTKQWNQILRESLRAETGFRLSTGEETQTVPIRVCPGLPGPLGGLIGQATPEELWLLLNRPHIQAASDGLARVATDFDMLVRVLRTAAHAPVADESEVRRVGDLAVWLSKHVEKLSILKRLKEIREDVLGAYFFHTPEIQLFWMSIGFYAATLGVSPEALTVVVLAHELAHAHCHLGRDIDGQRWETHDFAATDAWIVEGLAQHFTRVTCEKLAKGRMPSAEGAYRCLLDLQDDAYVVHKSWEANDLADGEVVRGALVRCRLTRVKEYPAFRTGSSCLS